jgi:tetratricopeptide (TPR) repeat protein
MQLCLAATRAACLFVSLAIAAGARAANTDEGAAKAHFAAGRIFFKDKRYHEAIDEFLQAYQLSAAADLLYNIALCYDAVDDAGRATIYFQRYLQAHHNAPERAHIEQSIYRLSSRVGRLIIHAPPGTVITVDGIAIEVEPPAPLTVTAGSHHIVGRRNGERLGVVDETVAGGLSKEITISAMPPAAATPSTPSAPSTASSVPAVAAPPPTALHEAAAPGRTLKLAGISLLAVGGAALVGGIAGSALAADASSTVSNESKTRAAFDPAAQSRGQHAALAADVLYGVGGAAVVSGVVLTVVGLRAAKARRATAALFPVALPGAAGLLVQGSFQ